ncbi:MAG: hypothetical protein V4455_05830 [Pseudomonadota bacterium]
MGDLVDDGLLEGGLAVLALDDSALAGRRLDQREHRLAQLLRGELVQVRGVNHEDIIFRACGQAIQRVGLFMRQQVPPADVAELLNIKPRQSCIALRAVAFLAEGDPIYYQQIFIPPNVRELHVVSDSRAAGYLRKQGV